jgi:hypothetical protein
MALDAAGGEAVTFIVGVVAGVIAVFIAIPVILYFITKGQPPEDC